MQRKSKTKQPKIREREIGLLILAVFHKNDLSLATNKENHQLSNTRFRRTSEQIFEELSLSREPRWAEDEALAYFKKINDCAILTADQMC